MDRFTQEQFDKFIDLILEASPNVDRRTAIDDAWEKAFSQYATTVNKKMRDLTQDERKCALNIMIEKTLTDNKYGD